MDLLDTNALSRPLRKWYQIPFLPLSLRGIKPALGNEFQWLGEDIRVLVDQGGCHAYGGSLWDLPVAEVCAAVGGDACQTGGDSVAEAETFHYYGGLGSVSEYPHS